MPEERNRFSAHHKATRDYAAELGSGAGENYADNASPSGFDYAAAKAGGDAVAQEESSIFSGEGRFSAKDEEGPAAVGLAEGYAAPENKTEDAQDSPIQMDGGKAVESAIGTHAAVFSGVYSADRAAKKAGEEYRNTYYRDKQAEEEEAAEYAADQQRSVLESGALASEEAGTDYTIDPETDWAHDEADVVDEVSFVGDAENVDDATPPKGVSGKAKAKAAAKGYIAGYAVGKAKRAAKATVHGAIGDLDDNTAEADLLENGPRRAKNAYRSGKRMYSFARRKMGLSAATPAGRQAAAQAGAAAARGAGALRAAAVLPKTPIGWALALAAGACLVFSLLFLVMCTAGGDDSSKTGGAYVTWATGIANDDRHGYAQEYWNGSPSQKGSPDASGFGGARDGWPHRDECYGSDGKTGWSDFDCSSLVYYSLIENGWTVEELGTVPFTTYTMPEIMSKAGFDDIPYRRGMSLQEGDVLISDGHTEIYVGNNQLVGAHSNSHNGITGDAVGDQTGGELSVGNFYENNWVHVMRCTRDVAMSGNIPPGLGRLMTWMPWRLVTAPSQQLAFKLAAGERYDELGFGRVDGRFVIACTTTFGGVGDYIDFTLEDGTVIECVVGDIKNQNDPGCNEWGHQEGQVILEFVTNWHVPHDNPGRGIYHPEWGGKSVVSYERVGHFDF